MPHMDRVARMAERGRGFMATLRERWEQEQPVQRDVVAQVPYPALEAERDQARAEAAAWQRQCARWQEACREVEAERDQIRHDVVLLQRQVARMRELASTPQTVGGHDWQRDAVTLIWQCANCGQRTRDPRIVVTPCAAIGRKHDYPANRKSRKAG